MARQGAAGRVRGAQWAVARRAIRAGEELYISYADSDDGDASMGRDSDEWGLSTYGVFFSHRGRHAEPEVNPAEQAVQRARGLLRALRRVEGLGQRGRHGARTG